MIDQFIQEALQAGLPVNAVADRLIRIFGIDADNASKLVAAFLLKKTQV